ncbi:acyl-coenzyme A thioesterase 1 [Latimeria chalumnae]|uniref:Uncharacterized protein n=1 Tax=Latimeria chalumnae TaxID=7897 RepID=H3AU16_LATCH|nr:PREDICTED: acyl-coenzyme A thioesterase 1-like [Latimeria chalumnae]|eukprot:XP_006004813.1 PREDICTED: acyl-coenzyme A thioesterase 1-like [Latimeria chalumnae]
MLYLSVSLRSLCMHRSRPFALKACRSLHQSAKVTVSPKKSLADEKVKIQASDLKPLQEVTLRALVANEQGCLFDSCAHYQADDTGAVDLDRDPSRGGDYTGIEPMGLLWSLSPAQMEKPHQRLQKREVMKSPMQVEVIVHRGYTNPGAIPGQVLAKAKAERWFSGPGIRRVCLKEGRVRGSLFLPPGDGPFPGVIDMFGDEGGLVEYRSSLLASRGFVSLALPYLCFEDLPQTMSDFQLEYFEDAVRFLQRHPKVKDTGIGVIGTAKGADLALSMASFLQQVTATVCISGCSANTVADLHYKDLTLPGLGYNVDRIRIMDNGVLDVSEALDDPTELANVNSIIPIEKAQGPFLFVVGEEDHYWKSKFFAEQAIRRLKRHGKNNFQLLTYAGAGHRIDPPCSPFCLVDIDRVLGVPVLGGGEAKSHAHAQMDSWGKIQDFLRMHLS